MSAAFLRAAAVLTIAPVLTFSGRAQSASATQTSAQVEAVHSRIYVGPKPGEIDRKLSSTSGDVFLDPPPVVEVTHTNWTACGTRCDEA
jgi:hypothetical protein